MLTAVHVSSERHLLRVEPSVCNGSWRDGLLFGASVVCFTTTTGLGPRSPYPRGAADGSRVHRFAHAFDPRAYTKLQMVRTTLATTDAPRSTVTQVHFLLLRKDSERERAVAAHLCRLFPERKNRQWRACFPGGDANDFATHSAAFAGKLVVNVMFWHAVGDLEYVGAGVKTGQAFAPPPPPPPLASQQTWLRSFLEQHPDEDARFENQRAVELRRTMARVFRLEGVAWRREFQRLKAQRKARRAARGKASAARAPVPSARPPSMKTRPQAHRTLVLCRATQRT